MLRFTFSSVRWLVAYNSERFRKDAVSWDHHALLNYNNIADDKIFRTNFILETISEDEYSGSVAFVLKLLELLFFGVIVDSSHKGDYNNGNSNWHSLHKSTPPIFNHAYDWTDDASSDQNLKNGVFKRFKEKRAEAFAFSF